MKSGISGVWALGPTFSGHVGEALLLVVPRSRGDFKPECGSDDGLVGSLSGTTPGTPATLVWIGLDPGFTDFLVLTMREAKDRLWLRSSWCKG